MTPIEIQEIVVELGLFMLQFDKTVDSRQFKMIKNLNV